MLKSEFISLLISRAGNRKDADWRNIIELEATQIQQLEIEKNGEFTPWFLESEWGEASTEADEERLPLPDTFIGEIENQLMQIQLDGKWVDLRKARFDEIIAEFRNTEPGVPKAYDITGDYIVFKPTPDAAYPIRMRCYVTATPFNVLLDTQDNRILRHASDWLMAATGRVLAAHHLMDMEMAGRFEVQAQEAKRRAWLETEAREHNNRTYRMES